MIHALGDLRPELIDGPHFVADNATLIGRVRLRRDASVWFNCVLRGDNEWIDVGAGSNIQDGSVLHTDMGYPLTIGEQVTVGHKVMLHGCTIGNGSLIGIGSTVLNGAHIGANCLVGANALVTENKTFDEGSLILGAPAKAVRSLTDDEIASLAESSAHYVENARRYLSDLKAGAE